MRAGRLRHRITIQQKSVSQDAYGEEDATWSTYLQTWASVEPLEGREYMEGRAQAQAVSHRVLMRHRDGVTAEMRVLHGSRVLQIESVLNTRERDEELELMCREMV